MPESSRQEGVPTLDRGWPRSTPTPRIPPRESRRTKKMKRRAACRRRSVRIPTSWVRFSRSASAIVRPARTTPSRWSETRRGARADMRWKPGCAAVNPALEYPTRGRLGLPATSPSPWRPPRGVCTKRPARQIYRGRTACSRAGLRGVRRGPNRYADHCSTKGSRICTPPRVGARVPVGVRVARPNGELQ